MENLTRMETQSSLSRDVAPLTHRRLTPPVADRPRAGAKATSLLTPLATPAAPPVERRRHGDDERRVVPRPRSEQLNRAVNLTLAIAALVILTPVLLLVALAVRLSSPGPVLYTQTRVGLNRRGLRTTALYDRRSENYGGRIFTIYKFRSMYHDAERDSGAVWASANDARVTAVGRVLRRTRLDELPQLLNVVKGDMNIVGPRPERPSIFVRLRGDIENYEYRQLARPGITGLAQVSQSYDTCLDDVHRKTEFDLTYLRQQGIWTDLRIMAQTVPVMIFRRGGW